MCFSENKGIGIPMMTNPMADSQIPEQWQHQQTVMMRSLNGYLSYFPSTLPWLGARPVQEATLLGRSLLQGAILGLNLLYAELMLRNIQTHLYFLRNIKLTVRCRYDVVHFIQNLYSRHSIARLWGRDMGRHLWVQTLIVFHLSHYLCLQIHVILYRL